MITIENTAITPLTICNHALNKLGEAPIPSLSPNYSSSSALCHLHYHPTRRESLTMARWTFATRALSKQAESTENGTHSRYLYQFRLPNDCLRVLDVNQKDWILQGRYIYTRGAELHFTYITDEEDCSTFDPLFTEAFATLLASKMAVPLTTSQSLRQNLAQEFHKVILPQAATTNLVQSYSNDTSPLDRILKK